MKLLGRTYDLRRKLLNKIPVGIAAGPFEFAVAVGYFATVLQVLTNPLQRRLVSRELFPGGGLTLWLVTALVSTVFTIIGQLIVAYHPKVGLNLERFGLMGIAAIVGSYIWLVWDHLGDLSLVLETDGATFLACVYKVIVIGVALEGMTRRNGKDRKSVV